MTKLTFAALCSAMCLVGALGCQSSDQQSTYVVPSPSPVQPKTEEPATDAPPLTGGALGGGPVLTEPAASPMTVSIEGAADRIAEAQCRYQLHCADKKKFDFSRCLGDGRKSASSGLTYTTCPKGVAASKLESCLEAVQSGTCKDIIASTTTSMKPCLNDELCAK